MARKVVTQVKTKTKTAEQIAKEIQKKQEVKLTQGNRFSNLPAEEQALALSYAQRINQYRGAELQSIQLSGEYLTRLKKWCEDNDISFDYFITENCKTISTRTANRRIANHKKIEQFIIEFGAELVEQRLNIAGGSEAVAVNYFEKLQQDREAEDDDQALLEQIMRKKALKQYQNYITEQNNKEKQKKAVDKLEKKMQIKSKAGGGDDGDDPNGNGKGSGDDGDDPNGNGEGEGVPKDQPEGVPKDQPEGVPKDQPEGKPKDQPQDDEKQDDSLNKQMANLNIGEPRFYVSNQFAETFKLKKGAIVTSNEAMKIVQDHIESKQLRKKKNKDMIKKNKLLWVLFNLNSNATLHINDLETHVHNHLSKIQEPQPQRKITDFTGKQQPPSEPQQPPSEPQQSTFEIESMIATAIKFFENNSDEKFQVCIQLLNEVLDIYSKSNTSEEDNTKLNQMIENFKTTYDMNIESYNIEDGDALKEMKDEFQHIVKFWESLTVADKEIKPQIESIEIFINNLDAKLNQQ